MRFIILRTSALFILICASMLPAQASSGGRRVRVLSYNIHFGTGVDGKVDLNRIARVINAAKPDVVALQEVDRRTKRTNGVDQIAVLSRLTGMRYVYGRTMDYQGGQFGNAVLTRLPYRSAENRKIPTIGAEARTALILKVATPCEFLFLATHFEVKNEANRIMAAWELVRMFILKQSQPAILAGDLNTTPGTAPMKILEKMWRIAGAGRKLLTIPVKNPTKQLDYILFRPNYRWKVISVRVLGEEVASDHRPILAELELLPDLMPCRSVEAGATVSPGGGGCCR